LTITRAARTFSLMRRTLLVVLLALGAACARGPTPGPAPTTGAAALPARPAPPPRVAPGWRLAGRAQTARGDSAMVAAGHPLAARVGVDILRRGGNAVDAAVAVAFAMAVVLPEAGNIGGGGFMLVRERSGRVSALDFREMAPGRATRDMYVDSAGNPTDQSVLGHLASGVPGSVAGLWAAHRRFGRLAWADLVAPAVRLARDGHAVDSIRSRVIAGDAAKLRRFPASRAQFLMRGEAPTPGTQWKQPDLARTLQLIADSGAEAFYRGSIATLIEAEMVRGGGLITRADLAAYRVRWRTPLQVTYRGHTIYTMAPASAGGPTLGMMLNIMEGFRALPALGSTALMHLEAEAMRRAYQHRNAFYGDPDFVDFPLEKFLSKSYAAGLRATIDTLRASHGEVAAASDGREGPETIAFSVADAEGMAVSATTTINDLFGSGVTVTGAGFLLNDEMDDFTTAPGRANRSALSGVIQGEPNTIAPRKRPLSSMTPTIVLDPQGRLFVLVGGRGGTRITTGVYHVISNLIDHDLPPAVAMAAPRVHHQASPDSLEVERGGFVPAVLDSLRARGHGIRQSSSLSQQAAIVRTATGWLGVGDPRGGGTAAGY
jgi:gamma-glutamyltranspeptidase/glutathione hydrolase